MIAPVRPHDSGRFEIRQKLGRGGMADVYLAQDTAGGYTVALKLIEHSADADTRDTIEAERRGALLQARLADTDTNVVRIYDAGDIDGFFYVSMEYVPGEDLAELLRRGPLPPDRAAAIARAVCETLDHAHTLRSHASTANPTTASSTATSSRRTSASISGGACACSISASPKRSRCRAGSRATNSAAYPMLRRSGWNLGEVNAHSDLWSLAVMLYEMAAGRAALPRRRIRNAWRR